MNQELREFDDVVVYARDEIVPIPAICTGKFRHEWIDGNGNGAIRAPSLDGCVCFWCHKPLRPHPGFPRVVDAKTRRLQRGVQLSLIGMKS